MTNEELDERKEIFRILLGDPLRGAAIGTAVPDYWVAGDDDNVAGCNCKYADHCPNVWRCKRYPAQWRDRVRQLLTK